jgi:hypothetical protein
MRLLEEIKAYLPFNEQEEMDKTPDLGLSHSG